MLKMDAYIVEMRQTFLPLLLVPKESLNKFTDYLECGLKTLITSVQQHRAAPSSKYGCGSVA